MNEYKQLLVIPAYCNTLGGMMVSLALLSEGFAHHSALEKLKILVPANSLMEKYLRERGQYQVLKVIDSAPGHVFLQAALNWVNKQPPDYPLLLDNCVWRSYLPVLLKATPQLRFSRRPVYHFCHDLGISYNKWGNGARKFVFACLAPQVICNSQFTASYIRNLMPNVEEILYQPVDLERFQPRLPNQHPPEALKPILQSGARIMLTPSRLNKPGIVNDKNLRSLIPVLAQLKAMGKFYHCVIIGSDQSPGQVHRRDLMTRAANFGVADRLTILPSTFAIEAYYPYADVVVSLAPREPFGRTVVEAIASGIPVVGSNSGGIREILEQFAPQWTVEPFDCVAVAETIVRVMGAIDTPDILTQGRCWVESHCSTHIYAQRMMEITRII